MLTYNEALTDIEKVLEEVFRIQFDSNIAVFSDAITLNSLQIVNEILSKEFEAALCEWFEIDELETVRCEDSTLGDIANEIMEEVNSYKTVNEYDIYSDPDSEVGDIGLILFASVVFIIFIVLFFL